MSAGATPAELAALARARALALRAEGRTSPNPLVGAVVLVDGHTVGEGWHEGPGRPHAEVMALGEAGPRARGATVVCTLEPCSHHGRTPPCTDALLAAGVRRVVVGSLDPLERGRAQGAEVLRAAGVEVVVADGADRDACLDLNHGFITWAATGRPSLTLKLATSLDGRIATPSGESRWITGPPARALVHRWRGTHDAVMVGIGTALADNPRLTIRDAPDRPPQPLRVVVDSAARLPPTSALARTAGETPVLVVASAAAPPERVHALEALGVAVAVCGPGPRVDLGAALAELGRREVLSLLVEGGARLAGALVADGLVDRVAWFLAPILIGGAGAPGALAGRPLARLADAPRLIGPRASAVGDDVLVEGRLRPLPAG